MPRNQLTNNKQKRRTVMIEVNGVIRTANIDTLYQFAINRRKVDPWELTEAAEALYKSAKVVGIENTLVKYLTDEGTPRIVHANELPERVRAFAAFIVRLMYRWDDLQSGRLEKHFGLNVDVQSILADTGVFQRSGADLACVTVQEVINVWAK